MSLEEALADVIRKRTVEEAAAFIAAVIEKMRKNTEEMIHKTADTLQATAEDAKEFTGIVKLCEKAVAKGEGIVLARQILIDGDDVPTRLQEEIDRCTNDAESYLALMRIHTQ